MDDRFDSPRFRHWIRSFEINWLNLSHPFLWKETHYYHYLESNLHFKILFSVLIPSHHLLFHEKNGKKPCRATATGHSVNISKSILFTFLRLCDYTIKVPGTSSRSEITHFWVKYCSLIQIRWTHMHAIKLCVPFENDQLNEYSVGHQTGINLTN